MVVTSGVRVFDPLTGETVDVTQITGGVSDLDPEKTRIWRIAGLWTLVPRHKLQLNAEYTDTEERNFVSSVPEASAAVMLAFPERFIRDLDGTLTIVDLRPINFDSAPRKALPLRVASTRRSPAVRPTQFAPRRASTSGEERRPPRSRAGAHGEAASRPLRLQLSANHSIVFEDEISLRPGFGTVDLLDGGAIGIAGGRVRHQFDGSAAISSSGVGARWASTGAASTRSTASSAASPTHCVSRRCWRSISAPSRICAASCRTRLGRTACGCRSTSSTPPTTARKCANSAGNTPLQYQPGYRDPIGRSVELELRKVF